MEKLFLLLKGSSELLMANIHHESQSVMCVIVSFKYIFPQVPYVTILRKDVLWDKLWGVLLQSKEMGIRGSELGSFAMASRSTLWGLSEFLVQSFIIIHVVEV